MITVFYDGKCGLCRREINYYRFIAPQNIFKWIDITVQPDPLLQLGIQLQDGFRILHVNNSDGKIYQRIDAFMLIWEQIAHFRWLSRILHIKLFYLIASFLYTKFAAWHFAHMGFQKCAM